MASWLREVGLLSKQIRLRSDGEPAVVAVLKALAVLRGNDANNDPLTIIEEAKQELGESWCCGTLRGDARRRSHSAAGRGRAPARQDPCELDG
eukprot:10385718-Heterocapsa_arctica.AAC.1